MRVFIVGGTGFVGKYLIEELNTKGYEIYVATRKAANRADGSSRCQWIEWDYRSPLSKLDLPPLDVAVNLAGESIGDRRWTNAVKEEIINSRVQTTHALVNAINEGSIKPQLLLNASAVGYYGPCGDEVITEDSPAGQDFLAQVCKAWEAEAYQADQTVTRVVTLRLGVVLGKGSAALNKMVLPFKLFVGGPMGKGEQWFPWIHIEDLTRAICFIMEHPELCGPVNAVAPGVQKMRDFSRTLGQVLGRPSWLPVPEVMLKIALGQMAEMLLHGQRAVPQMLIDAGFEFKYPSLEPALESILVKN